MLKISQRPLNAKEKKAIKRQQFSNLVGKIELVVGSMMDWRNGNNHEDGEILEMSIEQIN